MEYRPELYIIYSITALPVCIISIVYFFTLKVDLNFKKKQKSPFRYALGISKWYSLLCECLRNVH